jgi:glycosyltransferase involved in cell wall biosynthesis
VALDTLRRELSLGPWPVVLYSGNFEPYQGVELLLDALARSPRVQLLLMGGSPADVARMKGEARLRGVGGRCVFSGQRSPSDLPLFFALADVLASPRAKGENTPFKVFTYLASGKPLVATRIPTHTQLLDDATAFLVEPTPEGIAAGIAAALDHPEEAAARGRAGRDLIEREYAVERYREKIGRAYASVERVARRTR